VAVPHFYGDARKEALVGHALDQQVGRERQFEGELAHNRSFDERLYPR